MEESQENLQTTGELDSDLDTGTKTVIAITALSALSILITEEYCHYSELCSDHVRSIVYRIIHFIGGGIG